MTGYFSDRENGPRARTEQVISPAVWAGLAGTVSRINKKTVTEAPDNMDDHCPLCRVLHNGQYLPVEDRERNFR